MGNDKRRKKFQYRLEYKQSWNSYEEKLVFAL